MHYLYTYYKVDRTNFDHNLRKDLGDLGNW